MMTIKNLQNDLIRVGALRTNLMTSLNVLRNNVANEHPKAVNDILNELDATLEGRDELNTDLARLKNTSRQKFDWLPESVKIRTALKFKGAGIQDHIYVGSGGLKVYAQDTVVTGMSNEICFIDEFINAI